jgi:regulatory protein
VTAPSAYIDALKMLGRRELSERQLRERLARKEHAPDAIDDAIERLKAERVVDDTRVAEAIARRESALKGRGRLRAVQKIQSAGIDRDTARRAADGIFESVDASALLEASIEKRLRGRDGIADDREFQRLYRYLVGQGFESDQVVRALKSRRARR